MTYRALIFMFCATCVGCATTSDPTSDYYHPLRAGHIELEVQSGIFRIEAKSSPSFIGSEDSARAIWFEQAQLVCSKQSFKEVGVKDSSYEVRSDSTDRASAAVFGPVLEEPVRAVQSLFPRMKVGVRIGYVVCDAAGLSTEEASSLIQRKGWKL
jgi:hypothetical protein